ncbi:MAG: T9SS type A sorting domain-containing protein [Salinivirgaceae bacterium]
MKGYLLCTAIAIVAFQLTVFSQNELVIEVTTDNNSEETQWVLSDNFNATIQTSNSFADLTTYRDTIQLASEQCYYWTLYDTYGDGLSGGFTPGSYIVYFNGTLITQSSTANFGDSISVYNLGTACNSNDISIQNIDMLTYISKEATPISALVLNMGVAPITSLELFYSVGDFTSESKVVNGLSIPVGAFESISYPVAHDFNTAGDYTVILTITKINGSTNSFTANNTASMNVTVVDGIVKKNMVEMFTSAYCPPCPEANAVVDNTLSLNKGTYTLTKYLGNDGAFADLKYIPGNKYMMSDFYNANGFPSLFVNGISKDPKVFTPIAYEDYLGVVSDIKLTVSGYLRGDSIFSTVKILPMKTMDELFYLRGIAVQTLCHFDLEDGYEYFHPAYGFLPSPEGIEIQKLTLGEEQTFNFSGNIKDYPLEEGSLQDLILNFYIQKGNREIVQSENVKLSYIEVQPEFTYNINNEATNVDTSGLMVLINSNRTLFNMEGREITKIQDHLVLKQGTVTGTSVPFSATINSESTQITLTPTYGWNTNTKYFVLSKNFTTLDGQSIPKDTLVFTTLPYIGISDRSNNLILVYPNPAVNNITISSEKGSAVEILSVTGQIIEELTNSNGTLVHDISNYPNAMYFVKIETRFGQQVEKFLKQ